MARDMPRGLQDVARLGGPVGGTQGAKGEGPRGSSWRVPRKWGSARVTGVLLIAVAILVLGCVFVLAVGGGGGTGGGVGAHETGNQGHTTWGGQKPREGIFRLTAREECGVEGIREAPAEEDFVEDEDDRARFPWWRLRRLDEISDARCGGRDLDWPLAWRMHYAGLHREAIKALSRREASRVLIVEAAPGGGMGNQMMEPVNALFYALASSRALLFRTEQDSPLDWFASDWANWRMKAKDIAFSKGGGVRVHGAHYANSDVAIIRLPELAQAYREVVLAGRSRGIRHHPDSPREDSESLGGEAKEEEENDTRRKSTHFREGYSTFADQHAVAAVLASVLARPGVAEKRAVVLPGKFMHNLVVPQLIDLWEDDFAQVDARGGDHSAAPAMPHVGALLLDMSHEDDIDQNTWAISFERARRALLSAGPNGGESSGGKELGAATNWRRQGIACLFNTLYNAPAAKLRPLLAPYVENGGPLGDPNAIVVGVHQRFGDHHLLFESFGGREAMDPNVLADIEQHIGLNKYGEDNVRYSSLSSADRQLDCAASLRDVLLSQRKGAAQGTGHYANEEGAPKAHLFLSSDSSAAAERALNATRHDSGWSGGLLQTPGRPVHTVLTHKLFGSPTAGIAQHPNKIKSAAVANGLVSEDNDSDEDALGITKGLQKAALDTWILALADAVTRGPSSFSAAACYIAGQPRPSTGGIDTYPQSPDASMCVQANCQPIGLGFQGLVDDPDGDQRL